MWTNTALKFRIHVLFTVQRLLGLFSIQILACNHADTRGQRVDGPLKLMTPVINHPPDWLAPKSDYFAVHVFTPWDVSGWLRQHSTNMTDCNKHITRVANLP